MGMIIFVRKSLKPLINTLISCTKSTGIAGMVGNKGGVMISFNIFTHRFCFLNCHLAAGATQDKMDRRRTDAFNILRSLKPRESPSDSINHFDYFFWMGDFNFRVDCSIMLT